MTNYTNELARGVMRATAKRIAQTRKVDMAAAKKDEQQAISSMTTPEEVVEFIQTIIRYSTELNG